MLVESKSLPEVPHTSVVSILLVPAHRTQISLLVSFTLYCFSSLVSLFPFQSLCYPLHPPWISKYWRSNLILCKIVCLYFFPHSFPHSFTLPLYPITLNTFVMILIIPKFILSAQASFLNSKLRTSLTSPLACFMGILNLTGSKLNLTIRYKQKK